MISRDHSDEYKEYINSREWKQRRWRAILLANNRCQRCGKCGMKTPLEVHHLSYDRLGRELDSDLIAVCKPCHEKEDAKRRAIVEQRSEHRLYDARLDGWATKVYGHGWDEWADYEEVTERFERFLERVSDEW